MDKEEKLGSIVKWNNDLHIYELTEYSQEAIDDFIMKNTSREILNLNALTGAFEATYEPIEKIEDEKTNKLVWKLRTNLNKKKKEIETKRKQAVAIMISDFVEHCKGIEGQLGEASDKLTAMLNDYKPKEPKEDKPTKYVITLTTDNTELLEQIKQFATDNNVEIEIKEK